MIEFEREAGMELLLANPRGFCAGVERAVATVNVLLDRKAGERVYVRHEIVHNTHVVEDLSRRGAIFIEEVEDVPAGAITVISAHGVAPKIFEDARKRNLNIVDATCPLVAKVQLEVARHARSGRSVIVIGHADHVEVAGIVGNFPRDSLGIVTVIESEAEVEFLALPDPNLVAWVSQTTLAVDQTYRIVDRLRERFPTLVDPHGETICYATQSRQNIVRAMAPDCDLLLVVGAPHSSNSRRLVEVAQESGVTSIMIESHRDLNENMFKGVHRLGLTASASAPETLVERVIKWLTAFDPGLLINNLGMPETQQFNLPQMARHL
jgi:4-hydroxy-3-methylbut-2-en-1-yl diphosphate reductase